MSIESLCTGDTVIKQTATHALGAAGGDTRTWADAGSLDCTIQTPSAREQTQYMARGMNFTHKAYFSSDPSLSTDNRLKWTVQKSNTLATPIYLRVLSIKSQGRPGEALLWIAALEQDTLRGE